MNKEEEAELAAECIALEIAYNHTSERTRILCKEIARSTFKNDNRSDYNILKSELRQLAESIFADVIKYLSVPR